MKFRIFKWFKDHLSGSIDPDKNRSEIGFCPESTWGVTPGNSEPTILRPGETVLTSEETARLNPGACFYPDDSEPAGKKKEVTFDNIYNMELKKWATDESPFVAQLLEILGLTGKHVQTITLKFGVESDITAHVVRYITEDEGKKITDRLLEEVLEVKVKKGSRKEV